MRRITWLALALALGSILILVLQLRSGESPIPDEAGEGAPIERGRIVEDPDPAAGGPDPASDRFVEALRSGSLDEEVSSDAREMDPGEMRLLTRAMLEHSIGEYLPGHKLSSDELDRLADAVSRMREAQSELRDLPEDPEFAEHRRALKDQIEESIVEFDEIMDMDPGEFTEVVQPGVGVDRYDAVEVVPEGEFITRRPRDGVDE